MARWDSNLTYNAKKGRISSLKLLRSYLAQYKGRILLAFIALIFTSTAVLGMGGALRFLVDEGLSKRNPELLDRALWIMLLVTALLAPMFGYYATFMTPAAFVRRPERWIREMARKEGDTGGAISVARTLPTELGTNLMESARAAFDSGIGATAATAAALALIAAASLAVLASSLPVVAGAQEKKEASPHTVTGNLNRNSAPPSGWFWPCKGPPISSASWAEIVRPKPRPRPAGLVVKNGSKRWARAASLSPGP